MLSNAVHKSETLIEALPYIKAFRGKVVVVKLGGSAQEDPATVRRVFNDIDFMISVGMKPVVVYGGGKRISKAMETSGLKPVFVHGQRVTDPATMEIVARVLIDEIGAELRQLLADAGGRGSLLNGRDQKFLRAVPKRLPQHPGVDLGCVGEPTGCDAAAARALLDQGLVPLVAPVACGEDGTGLFNINGDTASALIARDLGAAKIVFLSDTPGIYRTLGQEDTLLSSLHEAHVEHLIRDGIIAGGMIPKVEACIVALRGGAQKAHIVSGYQPHALLLEIFTTTGVGTEIVH